MLVDGGKNRHGVHLSQLLCHTCFAAFFELLEPCTD